MTKAKILLVEDQAIIASDLKRMLEAMGWTVPACAASGEEGIEHASETRPDLVRMDLRLQGEMDGIEAAEHIQQAFGIPVIYLTAQTEETVMQSVRFEAPFSYVGKPVKKHEL